MELTAIKTFRFEAAHRLPWHPGACSRPHGHSYRLEVAFAGPLQSTGIVIDFADVAEFVQDSVISIYDHRDLSDIVDNPTAERIAMDVVDRLTAINRRPSWVRLWETDTCSVLVNCAESDGV